MGANGASDRLLASMPTRPQSRHRRVRSPRPTLRRIGPSRAAGCWARHPYPARLLDRAPRLGACACVAGRARPGWGRSVQRRSHV